ncbi:hypothetical protein J6590_008510 [Homalodisca vitripennis]|nr:hypothetical protein J6590_008510 [Homalodisca vitripennis]
MWRTGCVSDSHGPSVIYRTFLRTATSVVIFHRPAYTLALAVRQQCWPSVNSSSFTVGTANYIYNSQNKPSVNP